MKPARQSVILDIISQNDIETQNQLMEALAARGIKSTQATLSRDIKDMRLVKELSGDGKYRYAVGGAAESSGYTDRLRKIFKECVTSYDVAQNIIVIKTLPGLADAACSTLIQWSCRSLWAPSPAMIRLFLPCGTAPRPSAFARR